MPQYDIIMIKNVSIRWNCTRDINQKRVRKSVNFHSKLAKAAQCSCNRNESGTCEAAAMYEYGVQG